MASFPEEPLNLSGADGFGYFPANINQALNGGTYHVVRKLGWGTRSSTWLVRQTKDDGVIYWAAQIFTVAASKGVEEGLLPVLQNRVFSKNSQLSFPNLRDHFWVKSVRGEHLCLIVEPYGLPIVGLLHDAIRNGQAHLIFPTPLAIADGPDRQLSSRYTMLATVRSYQPISTIIWVSPG